jgi:hypothetical protein
MNAIMYQRNNSKWLQEHNIANTEGLGVIRIRIKTYIKGGIFFDDSIFAYEN